MSPIPEPTADTLAVADRERVLQWRRSERRRLLALRMALGPQERHRRAVDITGHLERLLGGIQGQCVAVYWPIRGEPNLRRWMEKIHGLGARCALPVVAERFAPLTFHAWWPGAPMVAGHWSVPVPAEVHEVRPDLLIAPMVGYDREGYRLGYGGGYYDRTLAHLRPRPQVIGVAYSMTDLPSIQPLAHDIPMDVVVTERGIVA